MSMYDVHDEKYWNDTDLEQEMRRVYDVCHTCRMCFSYCPSFPALFDAIDAHEEAGRGETDALTRAETDKVVDLCWQCKLCYVKCPYTRPHKFMVDFPRLMLRNKAVGVNTVYTHNYGCVPGSHLSFNEFLRAADDVGMLVALSQPHFSH